MKQYYLLFIFILVFLDQLFKILARHFFTASTYIEVIPHFIYLTYKENKGISFSFLSNLEDVIRIPFLIGVSSIIILFIFWYLKRNWESIITLEKLAWSFILGGAIGNWIDRTFRHSVTDYMSFHFSFLIPFTNFLNEQFNGSIYPGFINNFADDVISIGFVLLVWSSFKYSPSKIKN